MRIVRLVDPLRRLLRRGARGHAANMLRKLHAADVARLLTYLDREEAGQVFSLLLQEAPARAGEVLTELETGEAVRFLKDLPVDVIARILAEVGPDDAAELVAALPDDIAESVLEQLERRGHEQVEDLLAYAEKTAGRIMSPEVFALHETVTVGEAIETLRSARAEDLEMVFYLYVVDDRGHLVGVCSLRDLLLHDPGEPLQRVMRTHVVSVNVDTDQEEVAQVVARYNYLAVPVVDHDNKLVGLITVDDVIDIIREEETEDILLMAGVGEDEEKVLSAGLGRSVLMRMPWLLAGWLGGLVASQVISQYQGFVSRMVALSFFIPIIVGMGGNVGNQAATIVVRGMATGRLLPGQRALQVLRELRVALMLGLFFGVLLGGTVYLLYPATPQLGVAVGSSLLLVMGMAATVGATVPVLLRRLGVDPAIATGPFVSTSIDVLGMVLYFTIAGLLLR